jgi:hypothetical protein
MVPLIEGWLNTYENGRWTAPRERELYYGQHDHVRYYGADFRARVEAAGFSLEEFTAGPVDSISHRLLRGEKVFIARKDDQLDAGSGGSRTAPNK